MSCFKRHGRVTQNVSERIGSLKPSIRMQDRTHKNLMIGLKTHREKSAMVQNTRKGCTERIRTYRLAEAIHQNAGQNTYELDDTFSNIG